MKPPYPTVQSSPTVVVPAAPHSKKQPTALQLLNELEREVMILQTHDLGLTGAQNLLYLVQQLKKKVR